MKLEIKKLVVDAVLPTRAFSTDAGADLYSLDTQWVFAGKGHKFSTGVAANIPENHYLQMQTRSSLSKLGWVVTGGVIDSSYKGELFVMLRNISGAPLQIKKGERIAQIILHPIVIPEIVEVEDIGNSDRGESGYGSSGK